VLACNCKGKGKLSTAVRNMPHGYSNSHAIWGTQCCLPLDRSNFPAFTPAN